MNQEQQPSQQEQVPAQQQENQNQQSELQQQQQGEESQQQQQQNQEQQQQTNNENAEQIQNEGEQEEENEEDWEEEEGESSQNEESKNQEESKFDDFSYLKTMSQKLKKKEGEEEEEEEGEEEENDDEDDQQYGCNHYLRKCKIQAPCCKKWYQCRLCHDDEYTGPKGECAVERMNRYEINWIKCLICEEEQEPSKSCKSCTVKFARYYCNICHLWQNRKGIAIYHCEKCKMCRIGRKETLHHCDKCSICLPISQKNSHKCMNDIENFNCPVCMENMKHTTRPWQNLSKCGHAIHVQCLNDFLKHSNSQKCPLCHTSLVNMPKTQIAQIDRMIQELTKDNLKHFPKEFLDEKGEFKKVDIICNECNLKSMKVNFNPIGLKCQQPNCGSYQTDML